MAKTITIELPEPCREPLQDGECRYCIDLSNIAQITTVARYVINDTKQTVNVDNHFLPFKTKEDAIQASKTIIEALGGEV